MNQQSIEKLIKEFPDLAAPDVVLTKEVYAHFGLCFFAFSVLEHGLQNIASVLGAIADVKARRVRTQPEWEQAIDSHFEHAASLTLGNLIRRVGVDPAFGGELDALNRAKARRDYLTHHLFRNEAAFLQTPEGCWLLLTGLADLRLEVAALDKRLEAANEKLLRKIGMPTITAEFKEQTIDEIKETAAASLANGTAKIGWGA